MFKTEKGFHYSWKEFGNRIRKLFLCVACLAFMHDSKSTVLENAVSSLNRGGPWKIDTISDPGGEGDSNKKKVGMLVENFEIDLKGDQSGRGSRTFWPLKETNLGVSPAFFFEKLLLFFACNPKRDLEG